MKDFNGKVAIVTGGARGIGAEIVANLTNAGAKVYAIDLEAPADFCGDVTDKKFLDQTVHDIIKKDKKIDLLVNNAGIIRDNFVLKITEDDWDKVLNVNLKGAFLATQAVLPSMQEAKQGKIVNIVSASWLGNMGQANYAASKGGLVSLTRTLAIECARYNINVNAVSPGLIDTPMTEKLPEKVKEKLINSRPLRRMGKPADIANAVNFLLSERSDFITGQILHVDGGKSCGQYVL